jgi:hypothetical protein
MSDSTTGTDSGAGQNTTQAAATTTQAAAATGGGLLTGAAPAAGDSTGGTTQPPAHFFGEHIAKGGVFNEGWAENLRAAGFERLANKAMLAKDEATLFKTLDETIGFVGKRQPPGPSWPTEGSTPEEVAQFRKAAGVPEAAEGYTLKPDKLPEGIRWSDEDAKAYAEVFHAHNIPAAAAQALVDRHLETIAHMAESGQDQLREQIGKFVSESEAVFQREWGDAYDSRLEANRAFVSTRLKPEELADPVLAAAMSHPAIVRIVDEARRGLREAPLPGVGADAGSGSMSPREQARTIMAANPQWQKDPTTAKRVNDLYALDAAQQKRRG